MTDMLVKDDQLDFSSLHFAMQSYVDKELFAGISSAVMVGRDLVDVHCSGFADREAGIPLRTDHLFRIFSNTKLVTSLATLMLMEEGFFDLDDPIENYIPQLGNRQVLKPEATDLGDVEPARTSITIRQLLSHSSGLSYGFLEPDKLICRNYNERGVSDPGTSLEKMIDVLEDLPLVFHPGTSWEYSVGTDVLGRLVEIMSGQPLDIFFKTRIFDILDMKDTGFICPPEKQDRFAAYYSGEDILEPMKSGLKRVVNSPYPNAYLSTVPRLSGGGGLISTLPDMVALVRSLLPGSLNLLKSETLMEMRRNQLANGQNIRFAGIGEMKGRGYGLASSVVLAPFPHETPAVVGEYTWGGIAGTQWWVSPNNNLAGIVMTQRVMSFSHPFAADLKRRIYEAVVK